MSIYGRVAIINTLALCHINHIARIQLPKTSHLTALNSIIFQFLWHPRKIEQGARNSATRLKAAGGLCIPHLKTRCQALFLSRCCRLFPHSLEEITESWQKEAVYQIGTRSRLFAPQLFTNLQLHTDNPDEYHNNNIRILSSLKQPAGNWSKSKIKDLYKEMFQPPADSTMKRCDVILLWKSKIKKLFTNREG